MADVEFEEFRKHFEQLPQHIRASTRSYTLVHDIAIDDDQSLTNSFVEFKENEEKYRQIREPNPTDNIFKEDSDGKSYNSSPKRNHQSRIKNSKDKKKKKLIQSSKISNENVHPNEDCSNNSTDNRCFELGWINNTTDHQQQQQQLQHSRSLLAYPNDAFYSPDSEPCDSGNSTVHSPDDSLIAGSANDSGANGSFIQVQLLEATHRALYRFIARHSDELELEIGDPIYVQREAEDLWCEGINLRSGAGGSFPSAYVVDVEYNDFDTSTPSIKRERFLLTYLGSVETLYHKGNTVLCQAVHKIMAKKHQRYACILEVSDQGLKMCDRLKNSRNNSSNLNYFYSLKNVSFCGFYPQDSHYMGFITKHPHCDRFACHVFQADESTRPITESVGRAFQRFYQKYIETAYPVEDIYIE